jgi:hypothetical protein
MKYVLVAVAVACTALAVLIAAIAHASYKTVQANPHARHE